MVSESHTTANDLDPIFQPFVDFWVSRLVKVNDVGRQMMDEFGANTNLSACRGEWFDAISRSMDAYIRSPAFLRAMKQNTDAMVRAKRHSDDLAAEFARNANMPTANDISGLFERLHSVEETILGRLGRIEERLAALEKQGGAGQVAT